MLTAAAHVHSIDISEEIEVITFIWKHSNEASVKSDELNVLTEELQELLVIDIDAFSIERELDLWKCNC